MAEPRLGYRQVFDVRAAFIAGLLATLAFALVMMGLDARFSGSPWVTARAAASAIAGDGALADMNVFDVTTLLKGWAVYLVVGLILAYIIAALLHRFGLVAGIIGGAILGFSFYVLLYFVVLRELNVPSVTSLARWTLEIGHVVFGAVAGGVYEWLERARYVRRSGGF
jgi:hypothetical protein